MSGHPQAGSEGAATIWVSDDVCDYPDQAGVDGYWRTRDAAIDGIKARYEEPYRVVWTVEDGGDSDGHVLLTGVFESVVGYSTAHTAQWDIYEVEVLG